VRQAAKVKFRLFDQWGKRQKNPELIAVAKATR